MNSNFIEKANNTVLRLELEGFSETAAALRKVISDVEIQALAARKAKRLDAA